MKVEQLTREEYIELLNKVHSKIVLIAEEIKRICEANAIKYFLIGGTLLGAVRHTGFIPWDDDMDIGFLREDYEKFVCACKTGLSKGFELITDEMDGYGLPFVKIQMKGTTFQEESAPHYACGNGIYVDCFPIDKMPDGRIQRKLQEIILLLLRYALLKKNGYTDLGATRGIKRFLANVYTAFFSKKALTKQLQKCCTRYNKCNTEYYMNCGSAYRYGKEIFPNASLQGDLPEMKFENTSFAVPKDEKKILTQLYGDYMKFPPEDKRYNRHGIVEIDLGE